MCTNIPSLVRVVELERIQMFNYSTNNHQYTYTMEQLDYIGNKGLTFTKT